MPAEKLDTKTAAIYMLLVLYVNLSNFCQVFHNIGITIQHSALRSSWHW